MAKWKLSNLIRNKQIAKQNYSETSLDVYQRQSLTKGKLLPGGQARKPYTMLVGVQTDSDTLESSVTLSSKCEDLHTPQPSNSALGRCPGEMYVHMHQNTCNRMFKRA